jgi:hypothetical protein
MAKKFGRKWQAALAKIMTFNEALTRQDRHERDRTAAALLGMSVEELRKIRMESRDAELSAIGSLVGENSDRQNAYDELVRHIKGGEPIGSSNTFRKKYV